jgi:hypothetical protein
MGFNRTQFKVTKKQSETYAKNAENIKREYKAEYLNWNNLNVPMYKEIVCKDADSFDENIVTILPYIISSPNNMWLASGVFPMNSVAYQNRVVRHGNLGKNNTSVLCLKKMYGKACPLCEQAAELYNHNRATDTNYKIPQNLSFVKGSVRDFYLVIPRIGEQAGQLCLWEVSNYLFTQAFEDAKLAYVRDTERDLRRLYDQQQAGAQTTGKMLTAEDLVVPDFTDPDNGSDIRFVVKGQKMDKKYTNFKFMPRTEPLDDATLDKSFDLSEFFVLPAYSEVDTLLAESLDMATDAENGVETAEDDVETTTTTPPPVPLPATPAPAPQATAAPVTPPVAEESLLPSDDIPVTTPCPHNIAKKNSDHRCMTCPADYKVNCER